MSAQILIEQATRPAGTAGKARSDGVVSQVVTCSNTTAEASYLWTLVDVPIRSALVRGTTGTAATFTFTPDVKGTYLVSLRVNGSTADADNATSYLAVVSFGSKTLGWRYQAASETSEDNETYAGLGFPSNVNPRGWATNEDLIYEDVETSVWETQNGLTTFAGVMSRLVYTDPATGRISATLTTGGPPSGVAGGDLSGTYPNPTVASIQGRAVISPLLPADGDALLWNAATSKFEPGAPGVSDHGLLTGLADDDHVQYLLIDGTRDMTGNFTPDADSTLDIGFDSEVSPRWWRAAYIDAVNAGTTDTSILLVSSYANINEAFMGSGSLANPSLNFWDTGFYAPSSGILTFESGGADVLVLSTGGGTVTGNWNPADDLVYNLGTVGLRWNEAYVGTLIAGSITTTTPIDHGGLSGLADDDHTQYLLIDGTRAMTGGLTIINGAAATPGLRLTGSLTTGFYQYAANEMGFASNGTASMAFQASGIRFLTITSGLTSTAGEIRITGTVTTSTTSPAVRLQNNVALTAASGVQSAIEIASAINQPGGSTAEAAILAVNASNNLALQATGTNYLQAWRVAGVTVAAIRNSTTGTEQGQFLSASGLTSSPGYSFLADSDSGIRWQSSGTFSFVSNATDSLAIGPTTISSARVISIPVGAVGAVSLYFSTETTTGWYRSAANTWAMSVTGTQRWAFSGDAFTSARTAPVINVSGTNGAMTYRGNITTGASSAAHMFQNGTSGTTAFGNAAAGTQVLVRADATVNHTLATAGLGFSLVEGNLTATSLSGLGTYSLLDLKVGGTSHLRVDTAGSIYAAGGIYPLASDLWIGDSSTTPFASAQPWGGVIAYQHVGADAGSASLPTFGWDVSGFFTTGVYLNNAVAISDEGTEVANFNGVQSTAIAVVDGLKFTPAISTTGTGGYNAVVIDVNEPVASGSGQKRILDLRYGAASKLKVRTDGQIQGVSGSSSVPTYAFATEGTGMYETSSACLSFSADGSAIVHFDLDENSVRPDTDNTTRLGTASQRWSDIHVVTTTIGDLVMKDPHGGRPHLKLVEGEGTLHVYDVRNNKKYHVPLVEDVMTDADREFIAAERARWPEYKENV